MIDDLKPYPVYKDSGSPWLRSIPGHWDLPRLGAVFRERGETNEKKEVTQVLSVLKDIGVIRYEDKGKVGNKKSEDIGRYKIVRPDDIVVNCMNVIIGSVGQSRHTGCLSPVYYVLSRRSESNQARYLASVFATKPFQQSLVRIGNGILAHRMRIPMELLKLEPFPVPPPDEQAAIVRFLNYANGKFERAIRSKRKLIALLNEQKQAIIHRAVTRGLDPNVKLKPSGIPWLGDVPEEAEIIRLGYCIDLLTGYPFPSAGFATDESGTRLLRGVNVTPNAIRWDQTVRWDRKSGDGLDPYVLEVGDIVLGMDRPIIGSGVRACTIGESDKPSMLLQRVARLRSTSRIISSYLLLLLRGRFFADYMAPIFTGISVPHLSPKQIKLFKVILPTIEKQREIVKFVEHETSTLDTAINRTNREISLLREYRTTLTAQVVTGKLDVREAVKRLPAEVDEPLPTDDLPDDFADEELADDEIDDELLAGAEA